MPEEGTTGTEGTNTTKEETKETTTQTPPATGGKVKFRGRELDEADADYLMAKGLAAHQAELEAQQKAEAEAGKKEGEATENIDKTTAKEIAELRRELLRTQTEIQRTRMTDQMNGLIKEFNITKDDPEIAADIADLALLELSKSSEKVTLRDCFVNQVKKFEKRTAAKTTETVKNKTETKEKTQGAGKGASTGPDAAPKLTGKDLLNGGVRKSIEARLKAGGRGVFK